MGIRPKLHVVGNQLIGNVDQQHHKECQTYTETSFKSLVVNREMRVDVRSGDWAPYQAYRKVF